MRKNLMHCLAVITLLLHAVLANAMVLERVGADLFATGPVVDADYLAFKEAFAKGDVRRVVLVLSPGGDLWTGMQIARIVQAAGVQTLASGYCMSACSLMFIAGKERLFASGNKPRNTMIGIHGAHDKNTRQVNPQLMPQMYALYKLQIGEKFDADVFNQALYKIEDAGGFLRVRELARTVPTEQVAWFCPMRFSPLDKCQQLGGKDALTLGLVTSGETVAITLPIAMQTRLYLYGQPLPDPAVDLKDRITFQIDAMCQNDACKGVSSKDLLEKWMQADANKALALGLGKPGMGSNWGVDDPGTAMARALYRCNHAPANKKLCRLVAVNEQETHQVYDAVAAQGKALLASLPVPLTDAVRAERNEPGESSPQTLRTDKNRYDQMTPRELTGIRRVDSAELAALLKRAIPSANSSANPSANTSANPPAVAPANVPPVVIDVISTLQAMLPSAIHFAAGGLAFADAAADAAYDQRFRDMLQAASPDKSAPLVFYCVGTQSWHSVNAAMRALQAGYTNVMWYRGGLQAWQSAGLPVTSKVALAVIH